MGDGDAGRGFHTLKRASRAGVGLCAWVFVHTAFWARAHETDQYTLPVGREFADLRYFFSEEIHDVLQSVVATTNAQIAASLHQGQPTATTRRLQSPDAIASAVLWGFPSAVEYVEILELQLREPSMAARFPGLVVADMPAVWIYHHWALLLDPTKLVRLMRCSTVMVNGSYFGTDKIVHFAHMGYIYFLTYRNELAKGATEEHAVRSAVELGAGTNPLSERAFLGLFTTGVISNADLAADYAGLKFFRNLTEAVRIQGAVHPPMLVRDGEFFRLSDHVNRRSDFFKVFVSDHWNEVFNPNQYALGMGVCVQEEIEKRCDDVLDWYRNEDGRRMTRVDFERKFEELRTYYGEDYGQDGELKDLVSVVSCCFEDEEPSWSGATASSPPPNARDALGRTALWRAARAGRVDEVRSLLAHGVDVNVADLDGETPVHAAARGGQAEVTRLLVERGAAVNAYSKAGLTPLHLAARAGDAEGVTSLLAAGANPNATDVFGCAPMHDAATHGAALVVGALIGAGGNPSAADGFGTTPLHCAARAGAANVVVVLRSAGASARVANRLGRTPAEEAHRGGFHQLANQLSKATERNSNAATPAVPHRCVGKNSDRR